MQAMVRMRELWDRLRPMFLTGEAATAANQLFNYRKIWMLTAFGTALVTIIPLLILAVFNYNQYQTALGAEINYPFTRLVSNTRRQLRSFLEDHKAALSFIVQDKSQAELRDPKQLRRIFANLKNTFGGFVDLGLIDSEGVQKSYAGPYDLTGRDYHEERWFKDMATTGVYVSDVFTGFRHAPHFVIAVKRELEDGSFFILRSSFDVGLFAGLIASIDVKPTSDAFVINTEGVLQTPSRHHGDVLAKLDLPVPPPAEHSEVIEVPDLRGEKFFMGYAYIENSPFVFVLVKGKDAMLGNLSTMGNGIIGFSVGSVLYIMTVILAVATYLVNKIYEADLRRAATLHNVEHTNRMASIGRLAAGVAHEINNPLAIINEKAGFMSDLMATAGDFPKRDKFVSCIDSVLRSVERCSAITHRLLGFARHIDVKLESIHLDELIGEVLEFLGKEAQYRNIAVSVQADPELPPIESDRGQLQQVFLNIVNNAFAAMNDGGRLEIILKPQQADRVAVTISDTGCGIPKENLEKIFDPFFSTKKEKGTGLGLSITYGIVQKLGGKIDVRSQVGHGTSFTVILPVVRA
ncbi:MAG: two-component sensor histidine kinase [Desulfovibrionaceae bacterium]|nr:two-component sensor histidine kinase [Desulfovibrionaceae bacterium]MBF0514453.1 two-component sensor histidine kinase [Desulfovibrionaceae bacterium]